MRISQFALWTMVLLLGSVIASQCQSNELVLHSFTGGKDGADPLADLLYDPTTNFLFGTTNNGGGSAACTKGCGTVFAIHPDGSGYSVLLSFNGKPNADGANPQAGLVEDAAGNLYGTTYNGGAHNLGTVFELSPIGGGAYKETVLYSFSGRGGSHPLSRLVLDTSGHLYGTTYVGGAQNRGIVFVLTPSPVPPWKEVVLHSFTGPDGSNPRAGLVFDANGNLWGTTYAGGKANLGVVFQLNAGGESFLYSFSGPDGANPRAAVTLDAAGDVFGTTQFGGTPCAFIAAGCGVVFELQLVVGGGYQESVLYSFTGGLDGAAPIADLALVTDSGGFDLYGTASHAGILGGLCMAKGCGTAFVLCSVNTSCQGSALWTEYTLFDFDGKGGRTPAAGMVIPGGKNQNANPDIPLGRGGCTSACYGLSSAGGANGQGTLYGLNGP